MSDFRNLMNDFINLMSGMTSVAGDMRSEAENQAKALLSSMALQAGFVQRDEFDALSDRLEAAIENIEQLEAKLSTLIGSQENSSQSVQNNNKES